MQTYAFIGKYSKNALRENLILYLLLITYYSMFQFKKPWYSIGEASRLLGVSPDTLRRWEKQEKITCFRTAGNRRRYSKEALLSMLLKSSYTKKTIKTNTKNTRKKSPLFQTKNPKIFYLTIGLNLAFAAVILFLIFFILTN